MIELKMMRSQEELAQRIQLEMNVDPDGLAIDSLLEWVDYDHRQFVDPKPTKEEFEESIAYERQPIGVQMTLYLSLAETYAKEERGLQSVRSLLHYRSWLWLIGEDELSNEMLPVDLLDPPFSDEYGVKRLQKVRQFLVSKGWVEEDGP